MTKLPSAVVGDVDRLAALAGYDILDTPAEPGFDDVVHLACRLCDAPVSLVSLVAGERQWFKARRNFPRYETDLDGSVCAHALARPDQVLVIPDLTADPRTRDNPLVTAEPFIRFYAGAPLVTPDGQVLGTLCVIDIVPRPGGLAEGQVDDLTRLARQVMTLLELRRAVVLRDAARAEETEAYRAREALRDTHAALATSDADMADILGTVVEGAMRAVPAAEGGVVELVDGDELRYTAVRGTLSAEEGLRLPTAASLSGHVVTTRTPIRMADAGVDPHVRRDLVERLKLRSAVVTPLLRGPTVLGVLKLQSGRADAFTGRDLETVISFADAATSAFARAEARRDLESRDSHWRGVFEQLVEGMVIGEVVRDMAGRIVDWCYLEVNVAWEGMVGLPRARALGRTIREVIPGIEDAWVDDFGYVVDTGVPLRFERQVGVWGRWYEGNAFRLVGDRFAVTLLDVTNRVQAEASRDALVRLGEVLRDVDDPVELGYAAAELLGRTLDVSRVGYGRIDPAAEVLTIERDWTAPGVETLAGTLRLSDYGTFVDAMKRGERVVIGDVRNDPTTADHAAQLQALGALSFVNAPMVERGRLVAVFYANCAQVRNWTESDLQLIQDFADRTRAAVERARGEKAAVVAAEALRVTNATLERQVATAQADAERVHLALAAGAIIGTWFWDLPTDRFTVDAAFATAFGLDPALGRDGIPLARIVDTVHPDDQAGLADAIDEAIARGGRYAHSYRVRRHDGRYHWLEANGHVECAQDGTPLRFPGVLIDIASRRFDKALAELSERLRTLEEPSDMALAAAETVGLALDLSRVAYGDIDDTGRRIVVRPDWLAAGQPSIAGEHDFSSYGSYGEALRRGEDVVIDDVALDTRTTAQAEIFRGIDVGALVNLPLMQQGRIKVVFCLNRSHPHAWTADEVAFARRVADRTEVEMARRTAERELRTNEARQRLLLQQMPSFVGVLSGPDHVYGYVNDAYVRTGGQRQYLGHSVRDVFPDLAGQGFFELLDQVYATGVPFSARTVPIRFGGEDVDRYIDLIFQPTRDDDDTVTGVFVGGYDVTEQQRTAVALKTLNADLERKVIERALSRGRTWQVSPDLLVVIDGAGYFDTVNPAWTALLGWSEDELTHKAFMDFIHPDDRARTRAVWVDANERGTPVLRFENRYRHKDGGWHWLSWVGVPDDGKVYCSARDVTADKEQAAALLRAEEALRQSQKMEVVGQLTGGVAHDFNNLLTVIKSSTDLLKRPNLAEERRARYVAAISDTADRAAKLTGQLLAFARRQTLKPKVFAACDSVRALSDMMGTLTGSRITITIDLPEHPSYVEVDPSQFDTALVNLAVNARDAMDGEGQITITVRDVEAVPAIREHAASKGAYVAVSLRDTGSGIPPDRIERIFEPFFTTKDVGKGTGLGLSQVFGFVRQSDGDVDVDSTVGRGTTFTLYLPRVAAPRHVTAVDEPKELVDGHGTRVLVVEDNADVGAFAVQSLADLGYATVLAVDGAAALAELAKDPDRFDVVFSDVLMPGMDGVELGQEIRRLYHDIPVLLTSGYSHVLAQNGTYGFELLHKPYSVAQLSQMLRKVATWQRRKRLIGE